MTGPGLATGPLCLKQSVAQAFDPPSGVFSVGAGEKQQALLHQDEREKQKSNQNLRPPAGERAVESDVGLYQALNEHTDEGSPYEPCTAGQQCTPDNHRC